MEHDTYAGLKLTKRQLLKTLVAAGAGVWGGSLLPGWTSGNFLREEVFIGKAGNYNQDLKTVIINGFHNLGIHEADIKGKTILLKPNLVETQHGVEPINTHPLVIHGAIEAFLHLGSTRVLVGEGPGHHGDTLQVLEESGLGLVLRENRILFIDINEQSGYPLANRGKFTRLERFTVPNFLQQVDWIVSVPKMKTHHWAGVTLSMKNLFGILPGIYYGWPKNILHQMGIHQSIIDITATLRPHMAIVDGIVGMEGDGPIMGEPISMGVLVIGRNLPAVDATCARLMGIDPFQINYLVKSEGWLGPIQEELIHQRGEAIRTVQKNFSLIDTIPAHHGIRLIS